MISFSISILCPFPCVCTASLQSKYQSAALHFIPLWDINIWFWRIIAGPFISDMAWCCHCRSLVVHDRDLLRATASAVKMHKYCYGLELRPLSYRVKVIGCSSLRGGGGELVTLKTLTYGFLRYVAKVVIIRKWFYLSRDDATTTSALICVTLAQQANIIVDVAYASE